MNGAVNQCTRERSARARDSDSSVSGAISQRSTEVLLPRSSVIRIGYRLDFLHPLFGEEKTLAPDCFT